MAVLKFVKRYLHDVYIVLYKLYKLEWKVGVKKIDIVQAARESRS